MSSENVAWRWCGQCGSARWEGDGEPPNPNSITEPEFPPGSSQQEEERADGIVIDWLGGNCPVQAEGTFDGQPFYFRARGTSVTCEVGTDWCWLGPVYEWPDAGWIPEERARSYIEDAYAQWKRGDYLERRAQQVARNREREALLRTSGQPTPRTNEAGYAEASDVEQAHRRALIKATLIALRDRWRQQLTAINEEAAALGVYSEHEAMLLEHASALEQCIAELDEALRE